MENAATLQLAATSKVDDHFDFTVEENHIQ
jgi:hypothetical protein